MDFRVYLLARQCALLSSLGRVVEIGLKVVIFLRTFGQRLRGLKVSILHFTLESFGLTATEGPAAMLRGIMDFLFRAQYHRPV